MPVSIGLDLGIASVGYAVVDDRRGTIRELGVHRFPMKDASANPDRRGFRQTRRRYRRKTTRLNHAKHLLTQAGIPEDPTLKSLSPYPLRVKGLTESLTLGEIHKVALHIVKKRGIAYLEDVEDLSGSSDYTKALENNLALDQTPGQIQYQRLQTTGQVKSGTPADGQYQLNIFPVSAYAKELKQILETQATFHLEITQDLIDQLPIQKPDSFIGNAPTTMDLGTLKTPPLTVGGKMEHPNPISSRNSLEPTETVT